MRAAWAPGCVEQGQTPLLCAQVDSRLRSLSQRYDGPQPSDLCDLLEGEQFFAGFERGLDVSTGVRVSLCVFVFVFSFPLLLTACCRPAERPDCVEGRLCFVFYSSLENLKEVYICAVEGHTAPVRGQVRPPNQKS